MINPADLLNEVERIRGEMHDRLDELDQAKKAYNAGAATMKDVNAATTKTQEVTDRYLAAMRKALDARTPKA